MAPTQPQNGAAQAQRYADVQNLPLPSHSDALRAVMEAGERSAHLSQGYRPEASTLTYPRLFVIAVVGLALWALIGYVLAPALARALIFLGVFA